jgi:hypothetical protein
MPPALAAHRVHAATDAVADHREVVQHAALESKNGAGRAELVAASWICTCILRQFQSSSRPRRLPAGSTDGNLQGK